MPSQQRLSTTTTKNKEITKIPPEADGLADMLQQRLSFTAGTGTSLCLCFCPSAAVCRIQAGSHLSGNGSKGAWESAFTTLHRGGRLTPTYRPALTHLQAERGYPPNARSLKEKPIDLNKNHIHMSSHPERRKEREAKEMFT